MLSPYSRPIAGDRPLTRLELVGWRPGLQTVSLTQALRDHGSMSLWQAKKEVERLLVGETVVVEFATEKSKEMFREIAERLGTKVR